MMDPVDLIQRLAIALGIGLLIGVERGWREREEPDGQRTAGIRTFALSGLLGGVAGAVGGASGPVGGGVLVGLALAVFGAVVGAFKYREAVHDGTFSVTTVVAALLTVLLGGLAVVGDARVAAAVAVAAVAVLAARERLHSWLAQLTWPELRAGIVLLAMALVALPLLPDRAFGPYGGINPREVWTVAIVLAAIAFGGYVAVKLFGATRGLVVAAAAGGLVSSTAVTLDNARRAAAGEGAPAVLAGATLVAAAVSLVRTLVLLMAFAPAAGLAAAAPLVAAAAVAALGGALLVRRGAGAGAPAPAVLANPFTLGAVLLYAAVLGAAIYGARAAVALVGADATPAVAAIAGLVDLDAATLAMAGLAGRGLAPAAAAGGVLLAATANTVAKAAMGAAIGGRHHAVPLVSGSAGVIAAGAAVWAATG